MRAINTSSMAPPQSGTEALWIYNGLDCCVTREVFDVIEPQLDDTTRATYEFSRALQAPVLDMGLKGVQVDISLRNKLVADYEKTLASLEANLNRILVEGVGIELNWRSPHALKHLFYEVMMIPPVTSMGKVTTDRGALEKLQGYYYAKPIVRHLLAMRDLAKKIMTLKAEVDSDGRFRTSYNIGGTNTGRFSSSFNIFGAGGNFQNWEEQLRRIVVADRGCKLAYIDLEQAESRLVGAIEWNLFDDPRYLDACESGDLHTSVCKLAWPDLPWTGDLAKDRAIAEAPFYRQHSYRHMAKVLGHGSNYRGQPYTMAKHTKIPADTIKEFQSKYFKAFPAHGLWHEWVESEIKFKGVLTNLMGRRRWFFGRRDDAETVRAAVAFDPQGSVGDILNRGMLQVWRLHNCQLLMQIHDAILIQYPERREDEVIPQVLEAIKIPVPLRRNRTLLIPSDVKVGWNWANESEINPDGLRKYKGNDTRARTSRPENDLMDQRVYSVNRGTNLASYL